MKATRPVVRILTALAVALAIGLGATAVAASSWVTPQIPGQDVTISGCVLRFDTPDGTPRIHANYSHVCAGVTRVFINGQGRLEIEQTTGGQPIIFAFAQADETLATRGIIVGASGGNHRTVYRLYDSRLGRELNLSREADRDRIAGPYANLWVGWAHATR